MEDKSSRPQWSSNISFLLAAVGSAVGLGNIWRFPYIMGQNGGGVFLICYLIIIFTICFVPLFAEINFGQQTGLSPINAFETINKKFKIFGWFAVATTVLVSSFYFVVGGWIINYILQYLLKLSNINAPNYFQHFIEQPDLAVAYSFLFFLLTIIPCFVGLKKGIEKANNVMMPFFFIMMLSVAIYCCCLPNALDGIIYMFKPDWSKFNAHTLLMVFGQALFSLSVGMGALVTYGSYLPKDKKIAKSLYGLISADTFAALLSGVMIFSAVFAFGIKPDVGPSLVFVTLPNVFHQMPFGQYVGLIFFVLLLIAALSSAISLFEICVSAFMDNFKIPRKRSAIINFCIISLFMIPCALSFGLLKNVQIFNLNIFALFDYLTSNLMMPINTIIVCIMIGHFLKPKQEDLTKSNFLYNLYIFSAKYLIFPLMLFLILFGLKGN